MLIALYDNKRQHRGYITAFLYFSCTNMHAHTHTMICTVQGQSKCKQCSNWKWIYSPRVEEVTSKFMVALCNQSRAKVLISLFTFSGKLYLENELWVWHLAHICKHRKMLHGCVCACMYVVSCDCKSRCVMSINEHMHEHINT